MLWTPWFQGNRPRWLPRNFRLGLFSSRKDARRGGYRDVWILNIVLRLLPCDMPRLNGLGSTAKVALLSSGLSEEPGSPSSAPDSWFPSCDLHALFLGCSSSLDSEPVT